jgi:hypothetical protein
MPKIEQTIADVNVSSRTFHFVYPERTESLKNPQRMQCLPQGQVNCVGCRRLEAVG